ncbi:hypothetical protein ACVWZA_003332 [Sphingomonas sp. UYAg733]
MIAATLMAPGLAMSSSSVRPAAGDYAYQLFLPHGYLSSGKAAWR